MSKRAKDWKMSKRAKDWKIQKIGKEQITEFSQEEQNIGK